MAYKKDGSMSGVRGMCSYDKNPLPQPKKVSSSFGPGKNPDQMKANKLLQQAHKQDESLRGMGI